MKAYSFRGFSFSVILMAVASMFLSSCEEQLDMEEGNVTQIELNKEKYEGIPTEFYGGKEGDWEHTLWGNGLDLTGTRYTCFRIAFPKCKDLFATVPMYKKVQVTANGIKCDLRDMLADKYNENIYLEKITVSNLLNTTSISNEEFNEPWTRAYGEYEKVDANSFAFTFPLNPSYMERTFILTVSYSNEYPSLENPDSLYTPKFKLLFEQLGNRNHLSDLQIGL